MQSEVYVSCYMVKVNIQLGFVSVVNLRKPIWMTGKWFAALWLAVSSLCGHQLAGQSVASHSRFSPPSWSIFIMLIYLAKHCVVNKWYNVETYTITKVGVPLTSWQYTLVFHYKCVNWFWFNQGITNMQMI